MWVSHIGMNFYIQWVSVPYRHEFLYTMVIRPPRVFLLDENTSQRVSLFTGSYHTYLNDFWCKNFQSNLCDHFAAHGDQEQRFSLGAAVQRYSYKLCASILLFRLPSFCSVATAFPLSELSNESSQMYNVGRSFTWMSWFTLLTWHEKDKVAIFANCQLPSNSHPARMCRFFYASSACIYPENRQLNTEIEGGGLKEEHAWPAQVCIDHW